MKPRSRSHDKGDLWCLHLNRGSETPYRNRFMATPSESLARLCDDPARFLRDYYVKTVRAMHQSGPTEYWFGETGYHDTVSHQDVYDRTPRPGRFLGRLRMHNSKNFKFSTNTTNLLGEPVKVEAWHVDVLQSSNFNHFGEIEPLRVSRQYGPRLMVTTLLNGCTFFCQPTEDDVLMAHIQPIGISGTALETGILNTGAFNGFKETAGKIAFGLGRCYTSFDDVTILGIRFGQNWRVFAQIHPRTQRHISKVVEIFTG